MCSAHGITQKHMAAFFFFSWILFQKIKGKAVPVSVQFSHSVMSDSLWPPGLQPARLPCPSPTPGACSDSWSCSRSVMESVMPSSHLILCRPLLFLTLIFPSIRVFSNESVLRIGSQSIRASVLGSVLPMNIQDWFPSRLTGLIFLQSKGL